MMRKISGGFNEYVQMEILHGCEWMSQKRGGTHFKEYTRKAVGTDPL